MELDSIMSEIISVLMPVYNREKYVGEAIQSILEQTYKNFVIQVYDDGSTDASVDVINSFKDPRIKLTIGMKNKGVAFARNRLLDLCETKYAAWQDSDDISNIHRLKIQYTRIKQNNKLTYSRYKKLTPLTSLQYKKNPEQIINKHTANASLMFKVDKSIKFNENFVIGEDVDWHHRMLPNYGEIILDYVLYYIRYHQNRLGIQYRDCDWWGKKNL